MSSSLFLECSMWIIMIVKIPLFVELSTNSPITRKPSIQCCHAIVTWEKRILFWPISFFFFFQIKKISAEAIFKLKKRPQRANESHINGRFMNCIINQSLWEIKVKNILDTTKCYFWCSYGFHFGWNFLLATDIHKMA